MSELLVFYGLLSVVVVGGLLYSVRLYHKHESKHDHHPSPR